MKSYSTVWKRIWSTIRLTAYALMWLHGSSAFSQNLEKIDTKHPVTISGSMGANVGLYTAFGSPSRRDPFQWLFQGNLNINLLNLIDIPLSANFSQQNQSFMQPFNQYGASPKYKFLTLHAGYRNMTFSQLALAGHTFFGAGAEVNAGNWRFGGCFGRFRKAIDFELADANGVDISYKRLGYAAKVGYGTGRDFIDVSMLKAWDDVQSVRFSSDSLSEITPEENLVFTIAGKKSIGKRIVIEGEYGRTALTRDLRSEEIQSGTLYDGLGKFFTPRSSTYYRPAFIGGIGYTGDTYSAKIGYKRISPDYRSLGAYFFNNDVEEITLNLSKSFFKGKVNFSGSGGGQRNNLANELATNTSRIVGSANLAMVLSPTWNLAINGSNFSSFLRVEQNLLSDSLNFYQVSRNFGGSITHLLGDDDSRHTLNLSAAYQQANSRKEYSVDFDDVTNFYNLTLGYNLNRKPKGLTVGLSLTSGFNLSEAGNAVNTGPVLTASKFFKGKKIKLSGSMSYLLVFLDGDRSSAVFNNKLKLDLNLWKHHGLGFVSGFLHRGAIASSPAFSEFQFNAAYTFRF